MIEFNNVKIFTDDVDYKALDQIHELDKSGIFQDQPIRIMPDVHAGAGCVIGLTVPLKDRCCPNIVGVDIGCGMLVIRLSEKNINLGTLDRIVHEVVPAGRNVLGYNYIAEQIISGLVCKDELQEIDWLTASLGTLGGGNHFIELDRDDESNCYLIIHSGSRNLGKQVAKIYQEKAIKSCRRLDCDELIAKLKKEGRQQEIQAAIENLKKDKPKLPDSLCYVEGKELANYLYDLNLCMSFAAANRDRIVENILSALHLYEYERFTCWHNYINRWDKIIRKGSISARKGEKVLIPLNMRDGCILGRGNGNPDWNYSAPHGAGRIMSRSEAKDKLKVEDFQKSMEGIYTTTVNESTIDEAPFVYKPSEEIIDLVKETVTVEKILKPVYNFKASE